MKDCFWRWRSESGGADEIIIYTEKINIKVNIKPMAIYYRIPKKTDVSKNKDKAEMFALQFKVKDGSEEFKTLMKLLDLKSSDEKKPQRKKRQTRR